MLWGRYFLRSTAVKPIPLWKGSAALVLGLPQLLLSNIFQLSYKHRELDRYSKANLSTSGPLILYSWHRNASLSYFAMRMLSDLRSLIYITNDNFISLHYSIPSALLGLTTFTFGLRSQASRTTQISEVLIADNKVLMFSDSGGPYLELKPGIIKMAQQSGAKLLPIAFAADKYFDVGNKLHHYYPKLGATLMCSIGPPIELIGMDEKNSTKENLTRCEDALNSLSSEIESILK